MEDASVLLNRFESLGDNCEFGFVQRRSGIEPGGLLRWTVSPPGPLVEAIEARFEGIYQFENVVPFTPRMVEDRRSGIKFHSAMTSTDGVFDLDPERRREVHQTEYEKISYLRGKLLQLLETGEKTFVYKRNAGVDEALIGRLSSAIAAHGPSRLLYVKADPARAGTVEVVSKALTMGFVERFAPYAAANDLAYESWIQMLISYQDPAE